MNPVVKVGEDVVWKNENDACKQTRLDLCNELRNLLFTPLSPFEEGITPVALCQQHYNWLYSKIHPSTRCDYCGDRVSHSIGTIHNQRP